MKVIKNIRLTLKEDEATGYLLKLMDGKYNSGFDKIIADRRKSCINSIDPKVIYDFFNISRIRGDKVHLKPGYMLNGKNIAKILKGSDTSIVFISTLGKGIDEIIEQETRKGDMVSVLAITSIAYGLLRSLSDFVEQVIRKDILKSSKDFGITCAYSPGQTGWHIEEQEKIFKMVDGSIIGVLLNKAYLMTPLKSISGIYGSGPVDMIDKTRVSCDLCSRKDCISRR